MSDVERMSIEEGKRATLRSKPSSGQRGMTGECRGRGALLGAGQPSQRGGLPAGVLPCPRSRNGFR
eukprot:6046950-Alexandrium_andersonii.AAC.1